MKLIMQGTDCLIWREAIFRSMEREHEAVTNDEDNATQRSTIRVPRNCGVCWQRHECTRKQLLRHTVSTNYTIQQACAWWCHVKHT